MKLKKINEYAAKTTLLSIYRGPLLMEEQQVAQAPSNVHYVTIKKTKENGDSMKCMHEEPDLSIAFISSTDYMLVDIFFVSI